MSAFLVLSVFFVCMNQRETRISGVVRNYSTEPAIKNDYLLLEIVTVMKGSYS